MNYSLYFCNCGEPIDKGEKWCISCESHYEGKYDPVVEYAIRGYEDGLILLEDSNRNVIRVTQEQYQQLEDNEKVWYSFKGIVDFR